MQCNQLIRLTKTWFLHVKDETMAPARMMQFVDDHIKECDVCREDPDLHQEIEKIREFVLPESKIPKAYRAQNKTISPDISPPAAEAAESEQASENPPTADTPDQ